MFYALSAITVITGESWGQCWKKKNQSGRASGPNYSKQMSQHKKTIFHQIFCMFTCRVTKVQVLDPNFLVGVEGWRRSEKYWGHVPEMELKETADFFLWLQCITTTWVWRVGWMWSNFTLTYIYKNKYIYKSCCCIQNPKLSSKYWGQLASRELQ